MIPQNKINTSPSATATEKIEVDLDAPVEVDDATGDVNIQAKLPPHNVYSIKWNGRKENAVFGGKSRKAPHPSYAAASLVGIIQDVEFEGTHVYENHINSLQQRGKTTSDFHHFLNVAGTPAPNRSTIRELITLMETTLESSPVCSAEVDWKASYKKDDDTYADIKTTMTGFPKQYVDGNGKPCSKETPGATWDGSYVQEVEHPVTGEPVKAQLYVRQHLNNAEATRLKAKLSV